MRDASCQMYMSNRYYDPATGQFTQTDPIGLAGGLNAYGFAAGDPVTYSDPYGLCPDSMQSDQARCQARDQAEADRVAREALNTANPTSVASDTEYGGLVYELPGGSFGATPAVAGTPCSGGPCGVDPWQALSLVPSGATVRGDYHTHGAFNPSQPGISYEYFSHGDWSGINADAARNPSYLGGYLGTPSGRAYFYKPGSLTRYTPAGMQAAQRSIGTIAN